MWRKAVSTAAALVLVGAAGTAVVYRKAYGTWWGTPQRVGYCKRTYLRADGPISRAQMQLRESHTGLPGQAPYPLVRVATVPPVLGRPLLAAVTPRASRARLGVPCAMGVYLQTGASTYTAYGLSGGP